MINSWRFWALVIGGVLVMTWIAVNPVPAHAYQGHCPCGSYVVYHHRDWPHYSYRERLCKRCYQPRVYGYERRDDDDDYRGRRRDQCLDTPVDVLSTEHQTEDNARESARKLWMAAVQWRWGGQYMNLEEAARVRWQCGPSNAMDTIAGKISEAAGVLTGRGGQNVRCALWAHPCRTERTNGDERRR